MVHISVFSNGIFYFYRNKSVNFCHFLEDKLDREG